MSKKKNWETFSSQDGKILTIILMSLEKKNCNEVFFIKNAFI